MNNLLGPVGITDSVIKVSRRKARYSNQQSLLLGILAGLFIALGAYASNVVIHTVPAEQFGIMKLLQGAVFPVGLILVLVAGAELFTGNTLMILGVLNKKYSIKEMLNNWLWVYIGNFIGSVIFMLLIYYSGYFTISNGQLGALHVQIAAQKTALSFSQMFLRAILANFVVCLAVWMASGTQNMIGKVMAAWFPIMAFVVGGFEHSVANMYYIPAGLIGKAQFASLTTLNDTVLNTLTYQGLFNNLFYVTLGNIVGGGLFLSVMYYFIFKSDIGKFK